MLLPAVSLAFSMSLASFDAARSSFWLPGCRGWHFLRCPGDLGLTLWTWWQRLLERCAVCPYGAHQHFDGLERWCVASSACKPALEAILGHHSLAWMRMWTARCSSWRYASMASISCSSVSQS